MNSALPGSDPPSPASIARDPVWLAHRYDPEYDAIHFRAVSRAEHGNAHFLTDELLPPGEPVVIARAEAVRAAPAEAPLHFVFHSAFCCSTLIARALDRPGLAMTLKEPVILNDISGWRHRGGKGADMADVLNDVLALLARPFEPGEAVVIKPSNVIAGIIPAMLALRPRSHALLLRAPLRKYLVSIAKKGLEGRIWVRTLLASLMTDKLVQFGFSTRDYFMLTDLQVAAVGWLAQYQLFESLIERFGPERVRTLDSETLLARPDAAMSRLTDHFGLATDPASIQSIVEGPAFSRHSKLDAPFDARERSREYDAAETNYLDEIEKVVIWSERLAEAAGLAARPSASLLDPAAPLISAETRLA